MTIDPSDKPPNGMHNGDEAAAPSTPSLSPHATGNTSPFPTPFTPFTEPPDPAEYAHPPVKWDSQPLYSAEPVPTRPSKKATLTEMRASLAALGLDTHGKRETLFKRLNTNFIRSKEEEEAVAAAAAAWAEPQKKKQPFASFLCFDVEATCEAGTNFNFPNEIIEFPVVLLRWAEDESPRLVRVDTFHSYVRPTWRPVLTDFCVSLTGIQQSTVDASPAFPDVLARFEAWLESWDLLTDDRLESAIWVTDGPWDLRDFLPKQLHITPLSPVRYPEYFTGPYLNIKSAVRSVLAEEARRVDLGPELGARCPRITTGRKGPKQDGGMLTISGQVEALGLGKFDGRQHSGIDDASNIARVLSALAVKDVLIEPNGRLPQARNVKQWSWMGQPGEVNWKESVAAGPSLQEKMAALSFGKEEACTTS